ncbi:hypothetical protein ACFVAF_39820, partial [Streptomyces sp. NPDC057596]|uniref:hypothetical protein n=1 Tax=Streptomyces sp. NPDC057596 TaxID=3346178 RepID=UPI0036B69310
PDTGPGVRARTHNLAQYDSGKYKYTPIAGSGSTSNDVAASPDNNIAESLFFNVSRIGMLLILTILMIIFFLRAFPVVDSLVDMVPATKVLKSATGGKK